MVKDEIITQRNLQATEDRIIGEIEKLKGSATEPKRWLRSKDVQKMMGISSSSLQNFRVNKVLQYSKIMGSIFYDLKDVERLLEENKTRSEEMRIRK